MANPEHVEILNQGIDVWNRWREENPDVWPDLSGANLARCKLDRALLHKTNLEGTNLKLADLSEAKLTLADLRGADLDSANLSFAYLRKAKLTGANVKNATLHWTIIDAVELEDADFTRATIRDARFINTDLSKTKGLDSIIHLGPSSIGIDTITLSKGEIPESFLRGCGVPDNFIEYMSTLTTQAFQYYSCFISYSSKDQDFAERLYVDLQNKGVRCWYAPKDMKIGDKIRDRIDQSIRIHDKLLLILSEHSINSEWVEDEFESAFEQEKNRGPTVLFPVRLDDAVMDTDRAWAANLRRSRHMGDFTKWKDHHLYQNAFDRLLNDLKAEKE